MPATGAKPFSIRQLCDSMHKVTRGFMAISQGSQLPAVTRSFSSVSRPPQPAPLAAGLPPEPSALSAKTASKLTGGMHRGEAQWPRLFFRQYGARAVKPKFHRKPHRQVTPSLLCSPTLTAMRGAFVVQLGPETRRTKGQFEGWVEEVDSGEELRFHSG